VFVRGACTCACVSARVGPVTGFELGEMEGVQVMLSLWRSLNPW